jgi:hypothetical protein
MKLSKKQLRVLIETVLSEINLNTDAEFYRKKTPYQPGFGDNVISQRNGLSSSSFKGEYYEDPEMLYEDDESESDEDSLEEFSSIGGGAAGGGAFATNFGHQVTGYTLPLGMSNKPKKNKKRKKK